MDKQSEIKKRIMEHKQEFERLVNLPKDIRDSKPARVQMVHIMKAVQKLSNRYVQFGGNLEDLEEKKTVSKEEKIVAAPKRKRGSKKK